MAILKDIATLKLYNKVSDKFAYTDIDSYLEQAQELYLYHYLGKTLTDALNTYHNANAPTPNTNYNALLPYAQKVLVHFALHIAKADLNVNVTSAGFTTQSTTGFVVASKERSDDFGTQQLELAYGAVESLLNYMVTKTAIGDFASWLKTEGYYQATDLFIRTKTHLAQLTNWHITHTRFNSAREILRNVQQLYVESVMGTALTAKLFTLLNAGTLYDSGNAAYLTVYRKACAVIAYAAMYDLAPDTDLHSESYKRRGINYQSLLQQHLDATATASVLPEYYNSTLQSTNTTPLGYENKDDSTTFKLLV